MGRRWPDYPYLPLRLRRATPTFGNRQPPALSTGNRPAGRWDREHHQDWPPGTQTRRV